MKLLCVQNVNDCSVAVHGALIRGVVRIVGDAPRKNSGLRTATQECGPCQDLALAA